MLLLLLAFPVVLSEVMSNPLGRESGAFSAGDCNEFVELYNLSPETLDLSLYRLSDGDEEDGLQAFPDSSILEHYPGLRLTPTLPPGTFALILDPEYTNPACENPSPYAIPSGTVVLSPLDTDLGNGLASTDPLFLIAPSGDTVSSFAATWSPPLPPDGVSFERRDLEGGDNSENWALSRDSSGATPGRPNSLSLRYDLALSAFLGFAPSNPAPGTPITLHFEVQNLGIQVPESPSLRIALDTGETLSTVLPSGPPPDSARETTLSLPFPGTGVHPFKAWLDLPEDGNRGNDTISGILFSEALPLAINEIMYDDEPEWVELVNASDRLLPLKGLLLRDLSSTPPASLPDTLLPPGGFVVLTPDTVAFAARFPGVRAFQPPSFPTLNNNRETLFLGYPQTLMDSVPYRASWGGGDGVSLEKRAPDLPSDRWESWAPCQDPLGGTPGRVNSVYIPPGRMTARVSLSQKLFSPLQGEAVRITCRFPEPVHLSVMLFNSAGERIRTLFEGEAPSGEKNLSWNGTDEVGRVLPPGLYLLLVEARGERLYREKRTLYLRSE